MVKKLESEKIGDEILALMLRINQLYADCEDCKERNEMLMYLSKAVKMLNAITIKEVQGD